MSDLDLFNAYVVATNQLSDNDRKAVIKYIQFQRDVFERRIEKLKSGQRTNQRVIGKWEALIYLVVHLLGSLLFIVTFSESRDWRDLVIAGIVLALARRHLTRFWMLCKPRKQDRILEVNDDQ